MYFAQSQNLGFYAYIQIFPVVCLSSENMVIGFKIVAKSFSCLEKRFIATHDLS